MYKINFWSSTFLLDCKDKGKNKKSFQMTIVVMMTQVFVLISCDDYGGKSYPNDGNDDINCDCIEMSMKRGSSLQIVNLNEHSVLKSPPKQKLIIRLQ